MAERHKREAKLNRGRKAKNKGREVLQIEKALGLKGDSDGRKT